MLNHFVVSAASAFIMALATPAYAATCYFLECDDQSTTAPPATPPRTGLSPKTYWNHNGSIVYLVAQGNQREFYYSQPRQGMVIEGVTPGTLLFTGTVNGNSYQGTAYIFSAKCGRRGYYVHGDAQESSGQVIMIGAATLLNQNCQPYQAKNDVLVFQYVGKD